MIPGRRAFVFPGQGSQYVGMARDLYEGSARAREILERLAEAAGFDLLRLMFEGPEGELRETENAQPALLAHSVAALDLLREAGVEADMVAGHSLGEYTALAAAGALEPEVAVATVRRRGLAMAKAGEREPGAMAAVIGMDAEALEGVVEGVQGGIVTIANYNCPGQLVISGTPEAVKAAGAAAKQAGARGVVPLKVSGAFHSPLMGPVAEEFGAYLAEVPIRDAKLPVYCNVDAAPHRDAEELRDCLRRQTMGAVLWEASVRRMIDDGATELLEIGPNDVLTKMMRRIDSSVLAAARGTLDELRG